MKGRFAVGERVTGVGFWDSLWLVVPLALAAIPLMSKLGIIVGACFCISIALHLRGVWVEVVFPAAARWSMMVAGFGGVYLWHHAVWGMDPGISIMVVLYSIKLLELRSRREYGIVCYLGYFLLLCGLFDSQEFLMCVYSGAVFVVLTSALMRFHSVGLTQSGYARFSTQERLREIGPTLGSVLTTIVQSLPVVVILFFFFPRAPQGFGLHFSRTALIGMSDRLEPGGVEKLAENPELAFRVRFVNGVPPETSLYWRGVVLWECNGMEWERGLTAGSPPDRTGTQSILQEVVLEPHGKHWIFALDQPLAPIAASSLQDGRYLWSDKSVDYRQLYQVRSGAIQDPLDEKQRAAALQISVKQRGAPISARLKALAASWKGTDRDKVIAAERFFTQGFSYSLSPGSYPKDSWRMLDEFLFVRKQGFCSHYAAAFASVMRLCKVPSRIVMGYFGGDLNPLGGFYSIYQSDAHAWCEVYLEGLGWVRIDPTGLVTGSETVGDFARSVKSDPVMARRVAAVTEARTIAARLQLPWFSRFRYRWDAFNYNWTVWVLGYDRDVQRQFWNWLGLRKWGPIAIFGGASGVIALFLIGLSCWSQWRSRRHEEPLDAAYRLLCNKLGRFGVFKKPAEPASAYLARVIAVRPELHASLGPLFQEYIRLQFAPWKVQNRDAAMKEFCRRARAWSAGNRAADLERRSD